MADVAEIVSCDSTDVQSDLSGSDRNKILLLLRHSVVQLQLHLLCIHVSHNRRHQQFDGQGRKTTVFKYPSFSSCGAVTLFQQLLSLVLFINYVLIYWVNL